MHDRIGNAPEERLERRSGHPLQHGPVQRGAYLPQRRHDIQALLLSNEHHTSKAQERILTKSFGPYLVRSTHARH